MMIVDFVKENLVSVCVFVYVLGYFAFGRLCLAHPLWVNPGGREIDSDDIGIILIASVFWPVYLAVGVVFVAFWVVRKTLVWAIGAGGIRKKMDDPGLLPFENDPWN